MDSESKTGYEPDRIPASVFSTKPATATQDWSAASNESLFSIHIGNNSFSRDHVLNLYKSGELPKFDEHDHGNNDSYINNNVTPNDENRPEEEISDKTETKTDIPVEVGQEDKAKPKSGFPKETHHSPSISCRSDTSYNSTQSFAFPVFPGDQEGRSTPINPKLGTGKPGITRPSPKQAQEFKPTPKSNGNGWFSCFFCFSQQH